MQYTNGNKDNGWQNTLIYFPYKKFFPTGFNREIV